MNDKTIDELRKAIELGKGLFLAPYEAKILLTRLASAESSVDCNAQADEKSCGECRACLRFALTHAEAVSAAAVERAERAEAEVARLTPSAEELDRMRFALSHAATFPNGDVEDAADVAFAWLSRLPAPVATKGGE